MLSPRAAVIGSGISGIASCSFLHDQGYDIDLFEASDAIGGRIGSERLLGRSVDFGGKNIGRKYLEFRRFVDRCGSLPFEYFGFNTSQLVGRRVVRLSKENAALYNLLRLVYLCGLRGLPRLFFLMNIVRKNHSAGVLNSPPFNDLADRHDHDSLEAYFGSRCSKYVIRPVTVRMNGAEPSECYPGNFGSNLALALDSYEQLKGGMQSLLEAFVSRYPSLRISTGCRVTAVEASPGDKQVSVTWKLNAESRQAWYDRVVVALPAPQAAQLFFDSLPELAALLNRVRYFPVAVAIVKYARNVFNDDQRAMVFDASFPLSNAGAYGINDLDLVRYTFSGATARTAISPLTSAEEAVSLAEKCIGSYFNVSALMREGFVYKYLDPGLCAYAPFHHRLLGDIDAVLAGRRNLVLTGDYRRGASIEACFRSAKDVVGRCEQRSSL